MPEAEFVTRNEDKINQTIDAGYQIIIDSKVEIEAFLRPKRRSAAGVCRPVRATEYPGRGGNDAGRITSERPRRLLQSVTWEYGFDCIYFGAVPIEKSQRGIQSGKELIPWTV
jgi:hypothetical protein